MDSIGPEKVDDVKTATKPSDYYPKEDFNSQEEFLLDMVKNFNDDVTADLPNIQAALEDSAFAAGDQWDPVVWNSRLSRNKPTITVNTTPAIIGQVIGNRLANETDIDVLPDAGGTPEVARVRKELIRSIQKHSRAQTAYNTALQQVVIGGIGNFRVELEYTSNDVFTQDIRIVPIKDFASVVWDRAMTEPTGADAGHVFVQELMTKDKFKSIWPWAQPTELGSGLGAYYTQYVANGWVSTDMVRVVTYWRMRKTKRLIAMLQDGRIIDVTDEEFSDVLRQVMSNPHTGEPMLREVERPFAEMCVCTATSVLSGPYRLWLDRVPVFRVPGWEINVGETVNRFGLIRFAKDPMRMRNYWRSVQAEKLMQTPKVSWIATREAVEGYEDLWRKSHLTDDPLLVWNGDSGQRPERVQPGQLEPALIEQAQQSAQDIKDVTNIHEANLGQTSNEVSGKAINARQRIGELGTIIYQYNLNNAIAECGRVINDLIPYVYDTTRIIKTLGEDGRSALRKINDPNDPESVDITVGKYQVVVTTGPTYETRRAEAVESMQALFNAAPQTLALAVDLFVKHMDWPGAGEIADRLKATIPAELRGDEELTPEQQQQAAAQAEEAQKQAQLQEALAVAQLEKAQAEVAEVAARAQESQARAAKLEAETAVIPLKAQSDLLKNQTAMSASITEKEQNDDQT